MRDSLPTSSSQLPLQNWPQTAHHNTVRLSHRIPGGAHIMNPPPGQPPIDPRGTLRPPGSPPQAPPMHYGAPPPPPGMPGQRPPMPPPMMPMMPPPWYPMPARSGGGGGGRG